MKRENPPKNYRGEVGNERKSDCINSKRRRDNVDTVADADRDQQGGSQKVERGTQGTGR